VVVQTAVSPVVPANGLDSGIGQGCWKESRSEPTGGNGRTSHAGQGGRDIWFKPGRVGTHIGRVGSFLHGLFALSLQIWVVCGISSDIDGYTGKDEQESVRDKSSRRLGETEGATEVLAKCGLGDVVCYGQASCDPNNVLCAWV
jgi:hypothetical protein